MIKQLSAGLLSCIVSTATIAQPPQSWEPGFGGEVSILTGFSQTRSQFNTDDESTSSLSDSGNQKTSFIVAPLMSLTYTMGRDKQLFFGSERSDVALGRFHVELGYRQFLQNAGVVSFSVIPGLLSSKT